MKTLYTFFFSLSLVFMLVSCKDDPKNSDETDLVVEEVTDTVAKAPKISPEQAQKQTNSVMARVMTTAESKSFATFLVTVGLSDMLLKEDGPYTVFAPSDAAFGTLDEAMVERFPYVSFRDTLSAIIQSHVVEGNHDTVSMVQALKQGRLKLTSLSGEELSVSQQGSNILIADSKGNSYVVGKSDIQGAKGVVHILDGVLAID